MPLSLSSKEIMRYHKGGKFDIIPSVSIKTQKDLSIAYSPGVAEVSLEIVKNPSSSFELTNRGSLVAVISNGTAVLGLGNIGALASKPVMEGKSLLFKSFCGLNSIDVEIDETDPDKFIEIVKKISPTFGGINLEDIKSPECFEIEKRLKEELDIPVMHDDQHGTAVISLAGALNALEIVKKDIKKIKMVIIGAGAAAISCGRLFKDAGVSNLMLVDSMGVINNKRKNLNKYKKQFIVNTSISSLKDAMVGADIVIGLSRGKQITDDMLKSMADDPIIFAMANPVPEILPSQAKMVRDDLIIGTGRSDFPNQVNNVLGFPFIFRGAMDVRAKSITEKMKLAAALALAKLAKEPVPAYVEKIYNRKLTFGREYILPTPFDKRVLWFVAPAVAKAAVDEGINLIDVDIEQYTKECKKLSKKI